MEKTAVVGVGGQNTGVGSVGRDLKKGNPPPREDNFVFLKNYLFIWLHRVLVAAGGLLSCGSPVP